MSLHQRVDRLELTAGKLPMFLGLAAAERQEHQWVDWHIVFEFNSEISARSGNLSDSIDYVTALGEMRFLLWIGRFYLLETAVNFIASYFLGRYDALKAIEVSAAKKEALKEHCHPTLRVHRLQSEKSTGMCDVSEYPDLQCIAGPAGLVQTEISGSDGYALILKSSLGAASKQTGTALPLDQVDWTELQGSDLLVCKTQEEPYPSELVASYPISRAGNDEPDSTKNLFSFSFFNPVLHTYVK